MTTWSTGSTGSTVSAGSTVSMAQVDLSAYTPSWQWRIHARVTRPGQHRDPGTQGPEDPRTQGPRDPGPPPAQNPCGESYSAHQLPDTSPQARALALSRSRPLPLSGPPATRPSGSPALAISRPRDLSLSHSRDLAGSCSPARLLPPLPAPAPAPPLIFLLLLWPLFMGISDWRAAVCTWFLRCFVRGAVRSE